MKLSALLPFLLAFKFDVEFNDVMAEFTVPVLNLGFDASVLYAQRSVKISGANGNSVTDNRSYIDIPVNFKWKMSLFGIGNIVAPFLNSFTILTFCSKVHFLCLPMKKHLQSFF